jgi:hypothetical protein
MVEVIYAQARPKGWKKQGAGWFRLPAAARPAVRAVAVAV